MSAVLDLIYRTIIVGIHLKQCLVVIDFLELDVVVDGFHLSIEPHTVFFSTCNFSMIDMTTEVWGFNQFNELLIGANETNLHSSDVIV